MRCFFSFRCPTTLIELDRAKARARSPREPKSQARVNQQLNRAFTLDHHKASEKAQFFTIKRLRFGTGISSAQAQLPQTQADRNDELVPALL